MASTFDSFDASTFGDFTQSPLGDRNGPRRAAPEYGYCVNGALADQVVSLLDPIYATVNTLGIPYLGPGGYLQEIELLFFRFNPGSSQSLGDSAASMAAFLVQFPSLRRVILAPTSFTFPPQFWTVELQALCGIQPTGPYSPLPPEFPLIADALTQGQSVYVPGSTPHATSTGGTQLCPVVARNTAPINGREIDFVFGFLNWLHATNRPMMLNFWNV